MKKQSLFLSTPWHIPVYILCALTIGTMSFQVAMQKKQEQTRLGEFHGTRVLAPIADFEDTNTNVLGETTDPNKHIEVDLSNQKLYAYDGTTKIMDVLVSTGKWGATPTGEFLIERKVRSQTMKGGDKSIGTYYYLPNVQWVQFFGNREIPWSRGFSFHSTYWHDNFGHPMSHGCVNMKTEDAKILFEWAPIGTRVVIYGKTPTT